LLTKRHLALIRAALLFFDEEMSPHGPAVARPYFEVPLDRDLAPEEAEQLRQLLQTCELKYACGDSSGTHLLSPELTASVEKARNVALAHSGRLVTVLLDREF